MSRLINRAMTQYGLKEIVGQRDNPEILKYFDVMGFDGKDLKDETAWCSAFINWIAIKEELPHSGFLTARSWLKVGVQVTDPKPGDVVVLWRGSPDDWRGHVGLFVRKTPNWIYILGGNQSNQVKVSAYPKRRLLEYRRLHS